MVGDDSSKALQVNMHTYMHVSIYVCACILPQMTYQRDSLKDVSQPKHGKVCWLHKNYVAINR